MSTIHKSKNVGEILIPEMEGVQMLWSSDKIKLTNKDLCLPVLPKSYH